MFMNLMFTSLVNVNFILLGKLRYNKMFVNTVTEVPFLC